MNELSVFEMSEAELQETLKPMADEIRERAWANGGYISYYDESVCPEPNWVVREYRDRKELVELDALGGAHVVGML